MYDRGALHRAATYSYPAYPVPQPQKHYPTAHSTSSAFSASANPNEDWTKISDLAERRRIQNRIAQRNYRKKLKKRLEDLERRAGSSSASPEQKHEELAQPEVSDQATSTARQRSASNQVPRDRTPDVVPQQYMLPSDDRNASMFQNQFTRELSTSPPPFTYNAMPTNAAMYQQPQYYPQYSMPVDIKQEYYAADASDYSSFAYLPQSMATPPTTGEDDMSNPFSMAYGTLAENAAYTPPFDSQVESPPESTNYPRTPASLPSTPPLHVYEDYYVR